VNLPVDVDYRRPFAGSDIEAWQAEYESNVRVPEPEPLTTKLVSRSHPDADHADGFGGEAWWRDAWEDYADFEHLDEKEAYGFIRDY
jgi:hypothetical protein